MQDPVATIDLGHSSAPDAVATPWEETRRVLETAEVFWLATVRADGRPHVTPTASAWLDGALYFGTGDIAQKLKNLRGNPHVVLTTGSNHLATGLDVVVEGEAAPCTNTAMHERLYQVWAIRFGEGWPIQAAQQGLMGCNHWGTAAGVRGYAHQDFRVRQGRRVEPNPLPVLTLLPPSLRAHARMRRYHEHRAEGCSNTL